MKSIFRQKYLNSITYQLIMISCYILIKSQHGKNKIVARRLEKIDEIIEVNELFGRYDIIIKIETYDMESLQQFMQNKIWITEGIAHTESLIVSNIEPNTEHTEPETNDFD